MSESTTPGSKPEAPGLTVGQVLRRRLFLAYTLLVLAIIGIAVGSAYSGTGFAASLTIVEIVVLLFTLLILVFLSVFTTDSFSLDVTKITSTFERESSELLDRSQHHWEEQTAALTKATTALQAVVELETEALRATQDSLRTSTALLEIERQRESLRAEEARLRLQRIRPGIAVQGVIIRVGLITKKIGIRLYNQGEDGRRLTVFLRHGSGESAYESQPRPSIAAFSNAQFDFGDIDNWPDDLNVRVEVRVDDVDGNRYGCVASLAYSRNRGALGSDPSFDPADWQYPHMSPLVPS
jgi:hypothetical protein